MAETYRIDRYLTEMGFGSRRQIKEAAKSGRIQVDGEVETRTERRIDPSVRQVCFDGKPVRYVKMEYYMLNKPQGVVSATEDRIHRTVTDLIDGRKRKDLFPVGRLDIDTEGLLIITNDGDLAHRLLSPKRHVDKRYYAVVRGRLPEDARRRFEEGIVLEDGTRTMPARLEILRAERGRGIVSAPEVETSLSAPEEEIPLPAPGAEMPLLTPEAEIPLPAPDMETQLSAPVVETSPAPDAETRVILTIREGKFHQIKRMFAVLGCRVVRLKRISMGSLRLDPALRPGEYRPLTEDELEKLKEN